VPFGAPRGSLPDSGRRYRRCSGIDPPRSTGPGISGGCGRPRPSPRRPTTRSGVLPAPSESEHGGRAVLGASSRAIVARAPRRTSRPPPGLLRPPSGETVRPSTESSIRSFQRGEPVGPRSGSRPQRPGEPSCQSART